MEQHRLELLALLEWEVGFWITARGILGTEPDSESEVDSDAAASVVWLQNPCLPRGRTDWHAVDPEEFNSFYIDDH